MPGYGIRVLAHGYVYRGWLRVPGYLSTRVALGTACTTSGYPPASPPWPHAVPPHGTALTLFLMVTRGIHLSVSVWTEEFRGLSSGPEMWPVAF